MWHQGVMKKPKRLLDAYWFEGFIPLARIRGVFGDPLARIITLQRRGKKQSAAAVGVFFGPTTTEKRGSSGTKVAETTASSWNWRSGGSVAGLAA
jgi:hypothetical protein